MKTDPTKEGLAISMDQQPKYRDIFDFVYQHWLAEQATSNQKSLDCEANSVPIVEFIEHARRLFADNLPIAQDFMGPTLSLRFQDGSVLPFCDIPLPESMGGNTGDIQVSKVHRPRDGKGLTQPSASWGVTGQ